MKCMHISCHEGGHDMPSAVRSPEEATPVSAKQWSGLIARTIESYAFTITASNETKDSISYSLLMLLERPLRTFKRQVQTLQDRRP